MDDAKREILIQVKEGKLNPEEAAARLEAMDREAVAGTRPATPPPAGAALRIRVVRKFGPAVVIGDPEVAEAAPEGPHTIHREGDTLIVEALPLDDDWLGFTMTRGERSDPRRRGGRSSLVVRVNPQLPLEAEVTAGPLTVKGVRGPVRAEVTAGPLRIDGFTAPVDLSVQAGPIEARGRLDAGASRIRCQAGPVRVILERGSSVRVRGHAMLGKVSLPGGGREAVVGGGTGTLDVEATMGPVTVTSEG
ncbi:MAG TPA: hypothetical protein VK131_03525 [Candidatus Acidoferrales bacterium]|nr:hypothetical protein [Candidatus Acidoferrales bacterium]